MQLIKTQESTIAYQAQGRGLPIVFIHGFCEDSRMWDDFKIDLLEENFKVITIDLPGFGLSSPSENPSIEKYAKTVLVVLEELNINSCVVIGHSMGGYTALALADMRPDILLGLGLFHSHPYADSEDKQNARLKGIEFINKYGHQLYVKQLIPKLFPKRFGFSSPFDIDTLIHRAAQFPKKGISDALLAMAQRPDRTETLKNIKCPVLFIVGQEDNAISSELSLGQLPLPTISSVHLLKDVGHMGMFETKRVTQLIVRRFVEFCKE